MGYILRQNKGTDIFLGSVSASLFQLKQLSYILVSD